MNEPFSLQTLVLVISRAAFHLKTGGRLDESGLSGFAPFRSLAEFGRVLGVGGHRDRPRTPVDHDRGRVLGLSLGPIL